MEELKALLADGGRYSDSWGHLASQFRQRVPVSFNIGSAVVHSGDPSFKSRVAITQANPDGTATHWTYWELDRLSNRLANAMRDHGIGSGDRVAVWLPQAVELVLSHVAGYKIGAIVVPLFTAFGREAVRHRLTNSGAKCLIASADKLEEFGDELNDTAVVLRLTVPEARPAGGQGPLRKGSYDFWPFLQAGAPACDPAETSSEDPAFLCYTSGTTGPPKGALHAHRVLLGTLAGLSLTHNLCPNAGDLFWTPADWGWMGGLFDVLFPAMYWGVPVLAFRTKKFDPEEAFQMIERFGVQNAFIPPTALRLMRTVRSPGSHRELPLKTIASGGESLGAETYEWAHREIGADINEFYGQTECNLMTASCAALGVSRPGSMGKATPGRKVGLVDEAGRPIDRPGKVGELVAAAPDPIMMLRYWDNPNATSEKVRDGVLHTGDLARFDEDGYFYFVGRNDDVISSAGYRIGPADIEDALHSHEQVALAAAVGVPDAVRGEVVKAFVVLVEGAEPSDRLGQELQALVRERVGGHAYPREVVYLSELPMTSTGKVRRADLRNRTWPTGTRSPVIQAHGAKPDTTAGKKGTTI